MDRIIMKEDELVLCTVEKVTNTITFVRLPDGREGTIISSEIAPGRIKFMRQYVVPNKIIVCKILKDDGRQVHLSLRRVNSREKKEVMLKFKQEKAILVAMNQILGEDAEEIKKNILKDYENLLTFVDEARENDSLFLKYISKNYLESFKRIMKKKKKNQELKRTIEIKCLEDDGIKKIKDVFSIKNSNLRITYISAGKFLLNLSVEDFKEGKKKMGKIIEDMKERAGENHCEFSSHGER